MGKPRNTISFILPMLVCLLAAKSSQAYVESPSIPKDWRASLGLGKERLTNLHFFFHDRVNETSVKVASAPITANSSTAFGTLAVADEPLTEGIDPMSKEVGRAQGIIALAGMNELNLVMALSFSFSKGKFKGSSLSLLSQNPITRPVQELAIVGGTGEPIPSPPGLIGCISSPNAPQPAHPSTTLPPQTIQRSNNMHLLVIKNNSETALSPNDIAIMSRPSPSTILVNSFRSRQPQDLFVQKSF